MASTLHSIALNHKDFRREVENSSGSESQNDFKSSN